MTTRVWVDVGGTFTDCFVDQEDTGGNQTRRRSAKVLSSGIVRCPVSHVEAPDRLLLDVSAISFSQPAKKGFWIGANVSIVDHDQTLIPIGVVRDQSADGMFTLERSDSSTESVDVHEGSILELDAGVEAPVLAARLLLGVPLQQELPALDVRLGTTRGTNALLTRTGAPTALLVTRGFGDILRIGQQDRPDLFHLVGRQCE